jgi:hypothetical protein
LLPSGDLTKTRKWRKKQSPAFVVVCGDSSRLGDAPLLRRFASLSLQGATHDFLMAAISLQVRLEFFAVIYSLGSVRKIQHMEFLPRAGQSSLRTGPLRDM